MTVSYGFYDSLSGDRKYNAEQISSIFDGIVTDGIFQSIGSAFSVVATTGMIINVGIGRAWFNHTWTYNDSILPLTVETADVVLPRIDTVVIEINRNTATRANSIKIIKGTPASSPVPPTLSNSGTLFQKPLADILVGAGVTSIVSGNITNRIGTVDCPFITGILSTINMTWLFNQWDYDFNTWFDNLVDQLSGEQVTNLQNQINQINARQPVYRNLLTNGGMPVSQRGTSETGVATLGYKKAPDRWNFNVGSLGTWTVSQASVSALPGGHSKAYGLVCTTADASPAPSDFLTLKYKFEGQFLQHVKKGTSDAQPLTLSFWAKSSKTGTYIVSLNDTDNNRLVCASYTINSANAWEYKTIVFPADTTGAFNDDNLVSMNLDFWFAAGSNYTSGTLQTAWGTVVTANWAVGVTNLADAINNNFYLTGVQLEIGSVATPFEHLPFDVILRRCKRYYRKSFLYGTAPVQGAGLQTGDIVFVATQTGVAGNFSNFIHFDTSMRTNPTITLYNPVSANSQIRNHDAGEDLTSSGVENNTEMGFYAYGTGSAGTFPGHRLRFHYTADAEL